MNLTKNQLHHIYNQGNNQRQLFFTDENYRFFLWKMRAYLLPFGDLIAWCLMPNHFHWLFFVKNLKIRRKEYRAYVDQIEFQRRTEKYGKNAWKVNKKGTREANENSLITLNEGIGNVEHAYTNAINNEKNWTGSLFRKPCRANNGWIQEFVTVQKKEGDNYHFKFGNDFGYNCLQYIHNNPVKANLVSKATDYQWSSAKDYAELRKGTLCNLKLGSELIENI